jgi:hypothetical protein
VLWVCHMPADAPLSKDPNCRNLWTVLPQNVEGFYLKD